MPLDPLEAFDYASDMLYPHLTLPAENVPEAVALARRIRSRPRDEILLLAPTALRFPAVVAGLTHEQIEAIMRLGSLSQKQSLVTVFDIPEHLTKIKEIAQALARESGQDPKEAEHDFLRIRLYLNDHRLLFAQEQP
ncbi:hypothetical protein HYW68_01895 [Candidatus Parcubacteria bacterium]|nr:hypothetical protein [Candidatus Parcubacteria bacterium]